LGFTQVLILTMSRSLRKVLFESALNNGEGCTVLCHDIPSLSLTNRQDRSRSRARGFRIQTTKLLIPSLNPPDYGSSPSNWASYYLYERAASKRHCVCFRLVTSLLSRQSTASQVFIQGSRVFFPSLMRGGSAQDSPTRSSMASTFFLQQLGLACTKAFAIHLRRKPSNAPRPQNSTSGPNRASPGLSNPYSMTPPGIESVETKIDR